MKRRGVLPDLVTFNAALGAGEGSAANHSQRVEVTIDIDKTFGQEEVKVKVQDIKTEHSLITKLFSIDMCKTFIEDVVSKKVSEIATRVGKTQYENAASKVGMSSA